MRLAWILVALCEACSSIPRDSPLITVPVATTPDVTANRAPQPAAELDDGVPAEPFSTAWSDGPPDTIDTTADPLRVDSGACPTPIDPESVTAPYDAFLRKLLGLPDPNVLVALIVHPSFEPPWMLSLRRGTRRRRVGSSKNAASRLQFRITRVDRDVFSAMLERMQELQGPSVNLTESEQLRALDDVAVHSSTSERAFDGQTRNLFDELWQALARRTQVIESDTAVLDGTGYEFWVGKRSGSFVSPDGGTVLGFATDAAELLAHLTEAPMEDDDTIVSIVQDKLREALERTQQNERCVRSERR